MNNKNKNVGAPAGPNVQAQSKLYTLSAAVYSVLADLQMGEERFMQFLGFAIEGFRELSISQIHQIQVEELEILPWKQVKLPANYVAWSKVAFKHGDALLALTRDDSMPKTFDQVDGVPIANTPATIEQLAELDMAYWSTLLRSNGWWGDTQALFIRSRSAGYFSVDEAKRVINLKDTISGFDTLYLEYVSDGINYGGSTIVSPVAFKLVKDYIKWQRVETDDRKPLWQKQRAERQYNNQRQAVALNTMDLSLADIREALSHPASL